VTAVTKPPWRSHPNHQSCWPRFMFLRGARGAADRAGRTMDTGMGFNRETTTWDDTRLWPQPPGPRPDMEHTRTRNGQGTVRGSQDRPSTGTARRGRGGSFLDEAATLDEVRVVSQGAPAPAWRRPLRPSRASTPSLRVVEDGRQTTSIAAGDGARIIYYPWEGTWKNKRGIPAQFGAWGAVRGRRGVIGSFPNDYSFLGDVRSGPVGSAHPCVRRSTAPTSSIIANGCSTSTKFRRA